MAFQSDTASAPPQPPFPVTIITLRLLPSEVRTFKIALTSKQRLLNWMFMRIHLGETLLRIGVSSHVDRRHYFDKRRPRAADHPSVPR